MTEPAIAATAPVFLVDGELARDLGRDCVRLEVAEGNGGLRTLEAHLVAVDSSATGPPDRLLHLDGGDVDLGRSVQVALGAEAVQRVVFEGTVSAIELELRDGGPPTVVVRAEDALMRLRMTRRMRTYREVDDAGIAAELAREHGLRVDAEAPGPVYDVVHQANQSDLAFLRERARLVQAELWCTGQTLHFRSRSSRRGGEVPLVLGNHLLSARLSADLAHQRSQVAVTGFDAAGQGVIDERAAAAVIDAEAAGGLTGPRLVERVLGSSESLRVREAVLTVAEARAYAEAEMLRRGRRFVTVSGTARGDGDVAVGSRLRLVDVGAPFAGGGYYVTRVRHTFDQVEGFRTRFEAERATLNEVAG